MIAGLNLLMHWGIIYLLRTQNFSKNQHFSPSNGVKKVSFLENFAYELNKWSLT